jgi:hypothetical protein
MWVGRVVIGLGLCASLACASPRGAAPLASDQAVALSAEVRSFMLPVGFSHSSFTKMSAQPAGTTFRSLTSDVFPMALRMSMR